MYQKADKIRKKPAVLFSVEEEQKLDFLHDNEILYNNRLMDYKDSQRERQCGITFVRRTTWTKMPAKDGFRASAHSSERPLTWSRARVNHS